MREQGAELERLGADVLVVTFEAPERVAEFSQVERIPFTVLSDPSRRAYEAFGLRRGRLHQIFSRDTLAAYARAMLRGRWPGWPRGDIGQLGGDFVLDETGQIVFSYRSRDPADRPSVDQLLAAVRETMVKGGEEEAP